MQHLEEGTIHAWLDGALAPDEAQRAEAHMASCETCSALVAEARGLIAAASRILTALDQVPSDVIPLRAAGESIEHDRLAELRARKALERQVAARRRRTRSAFVAAAAIVFVAVGSLTVARHGGVPALGSSRYGMVKDVAPVPATSPPSSSESAIARAGVAADKPDAAAEKKVVPPASRVAAPRENENRAGARPSAPPAGRREADAFVRPGSAADSLVAVETRDARQNVRPLAQGQARQDRAAASQLQQQVVVPSQSSITERSRQLPLIDFAGKQAVRDSSVAAQSAATPVPAAPMRRIDSTLRLQEVVVTGVGAAAVARVTTNSFAGCYQLRRLAADTGRDLSFPSRVMLDTVITSRRGDSLTFRARSLDPAVPLGDTELGWRLLATASQVELRLTRDSTLIAARVAIPVRLEVAAAEASARGSVQGAQRIADAADYSAVRVTCPR
jgi:hypothetical protein